MTLLYLEIESGLCCGGIGGRRENILAGGSVGAISEIPLW